MYARVTRVTGPPEAADQAAAWFRESALPGLQSQPGFVGALDLFDRESHTGMTITIWESEDARAASESVAAGMREEGTSQLGAEIVGVERYEVATSTF